MTSYSIENPTTPQTFKCEINRGVVDMGAGHIVQGEGAVEMHLVCHLPTMINSATLKVKAGMLRNALLDLYARRGDAEPLTSEETNAMQAMHYQVKVSGYLSPVLLYQPTVPATIAPSNEIDVTEFYIYDNSIPYVRLANIPRTRTGRTIPDENDLGEEEDIDIPLDEDQGNFDDMEEEEDIDIPLDEDQGNFNDMEEDEEQQEVVDEGQDSEFEEYGVSFAVNKPEDTSTTKEDSPNATVDDEDTSTSSIGSRKRQRTLSSSSLTSSVAGSTISGTSSLTGGLSGLKLADSQASSSTMNLRNRVMASRRNLGGKKEESKKKQDQQQPKGKGKSKKKDKGKGKAK